MVVIKTIVALCMLVNGNLDGHMMAESVSDCLKLKREAERNLATDRKSVIRFECGFVEAELEPDMEGKLKIKKILKNKS